jgi:ubiquinone/menaquinone biosynthesis C-methylase UbiE
VVTDIDPAMVRAARQRLRDHPEVTVVEADVTDLPFGDVASMSPRPGNGIQ